jgi:hypothetical protein
MGFARPIRAMRVAAFAFVAVLTPGGQAVAASPMLSSADLIEAATSTSGQVAGRPVTGTFSIVAADPDAGVCGAAVASKFPAVGQVVPYVRAGVGAFCTQHWHEPKWGERALDRCPRPGKVA